MRDSNPFFENTLVEAGVSRNSQGCSVGEMRAVQPHDYRDRELRLYQLHQTKALFHFEQLDAPLSDSAPRGSYQVTAHSMPQSRRWVYAECQPFANPSQRRPPPPLQEIHIRREPCRIRVHTKDARVMPQPPQPRCDIVDVRYNTVSRSIRRPLRGKKRY